MKTGIEWQVSSLEPSRRLKELGVKQESYFVYYPHDESVVTANRYFLQSTHDSNYDADLWPIEKAIAAFTVAELGEMLPQSMRSDVECGGENTSDFVSIHSSGKGWRCGYMCRGCAHFKEGLKSEQSVTEADARAKCLIYLIENDLIKV